MVVPERYIEMSYGRLWTTPILSRLVVPLPSFGPTPPWSILPHYEPSVKERLLNDVGSNLRTGPFELILFSPTIDRNRPDGVTQTQIY